MEEELRERPPANILVPELLAQQMVYFLQANTTQEDRGTLPKPADFLPWGSSQVSVEDRIKELDKKIAALPADDEETLSKLCRERAKLLVEEF